MLKRASTEGQEGTRRAMEAQGERQDHQEGLAGKSTAQVVHCMIQAGRLSRHPISINSLDTHDEELEVGLWGLKDTP